MMSCLGVAFHFVNFKADSDMAAVIIFILGGGFALCALAIFFHAVCVRA